MFNIGNTTLIISIGIIVYFSGCQSNHIPISEGGFYYETIYFGKDLSATYKKGITDGCQTAKGIYSKSHYQFNNKKEYNDGWFLGRNKCRKLLRIDENGDLIL